jgi:hypothetical protein
MVVLRINIPVEFSFLYTTRSSSDLTFKQYGQVHSSRDSAAPDRKADGALYRFSCAAISAENASTVRPSYLVKPPFTR